MSKFNRDASTNLLHMVSDCGLMVAAFLAATLIAGLPLYDSLELYGPLAAMFMLIFVAVNKNARTYNVTTFFYVDRTIFTITKSFIIAMIPTALIVVDYVAKTTVSLRFFVSYVVAS